MSRIRIINSFADLKSRFIEMFGDPVLNPKGWSKDKLKNLLSIERGGSPRPINAYITNDDNGLNWIKIGDAVEGSYYINSVKEKIKPEGLKKTRQVYPGDLILSNSMSFGKPYILNISGCIHDGWLVLHDSNNTFNKLFLCIILGFPSITTTFNGLARGGVVNNLNKDLVGDLDIIVPPRDLQDEFIQFVEQVDKSKVISPIVNIKSRFIEMFGTRETYENKWIMKHFNECCDVLYGFPFDSELFNEKGVGKPLIRVRDINSGFSGTYTTEEVDNQYLISNGDLLVSMDGDFCAKIWYFVV